MNHWPFIWWSYAVSAMILLWTAVAPLLRQRIARRNIRMLEQQKPYSGDRNHDANP